MPSKSSSKFAGMIPRNVPEEEPPIPAESIDSSSAPSRGRRSGKVAKNSSKDFRQTNFYVHVDTFADAYAKLRKERSGKDMSDLVNELMAKWLKEPAS